MNALFLAWTGRVPVPGLALLPIAAIGAIGSFCGCSSTPAPAPLPPAAAVAERTAAQAAKLSESGNWPGAAGTWKLAADRYALLNDRAGEAVALHNLAQAKRELAAHDEAHTLLEQAAQLNQALVRQEEWWRNQIGLLQVEALLDQRELLQKRLQTLTARRGEIRDDALQGLFLNELALWQQSQGEIEQATQTLREAERRFQSAKDAAGLATVLANRAAFLETQGQYEDAIESWQAALVRFEKLAAPQDIARALVGQGRARLAARKDLLIAEDLLRRAAQNYQTLGLARERQGALELVAQCLHGQGREDEAARIRDQLRGSPVPDKQ